MSEYSLIGIDGNAFSVMGYVSSCMRKEGKNEQEIADYTKEAMSGNYEHLLCVSQDMIDNLNEKVT